MSYEFKKTDVMEFADTFPVAKQEKGNELFFRQCPYCNGGQHRDKNTFSINLENGTFKCFRSSCGKQGHFVELARDFGFQLDFGELRQYKKVTQKKIEVREPALQYLKSRGIGKETALRYGITNRTDKPGILVFPFQDENNVRQFIKYRNTNFNGKGNKEWCEAEARPILFGMYQCEGFERLVITEGQIDSLSLAECGIKNAVSVPNGARGFTWFQHCRDWVEKFKEVVVFGDYENGRITLVEELRNRLSQKLRVVRVQDYLGEKDANAILMKYGRKAVIAAVEHAAVPELKNVKDLSLVETVDITNLPKMKTNIDEIDKVIGGFYFGQLIILSGERGNGKSTFASQTIAEALEQDLNVFVYSGELADYHFKRWLDYQLAGPKNVTVRKNEYGEEEYSVPQEMIERINSWYKGRAFIYDNNFVPDNEGEYETLLSTVEKAIRQFDVKYICIDNLMTAMDFVEDQSNLYLAQSNFVGALKKMAVRYNVAILLVAHPRKTRDGFKNDDVSGSADITNKADLVLAYNRDEQEEYDSHLIISKNRLTGKLAKGTKAIGLYYSASTKRITGASSGMRIYGWERKYSISDGFYEIHDEDQCPF